MGGGSRPATRRRGNGRLNAGERIARHIGAIMSVPVQRLGEVARPALLDHFMHLPADDVRLRFGTTFGIDTGEADAFLKLAPADSASLSGELVEQRLALFDYALKTQTAALRRIAESLDDRTAERTASDDESLS